MEIITVTKKRPETYEDCMNIQCYYMPNSDACDALEKEN